MKKFFRYIFNCFYWCLDPILFIMEVIVEAISSLLNFSFSVGINVIKRCQNLFNIQTWGKPMDKKAFDGSYIMRGVRMLTVMMIQAIIFACLLQVFPQVRSLFASLGLFFRTPWVQVSAIIAGLILLLPQQQLFRDPVTRSFFRRGWFKNYGRASFFTKCLSFFIILILFCGAWVIY
jgi:hypothetical protein